jgi:hypothetical protein
MDVLTFQFTATTASGLRPLLKEIACRPPPKYAGLCARHFKQEKQTVWGRYLFHDLVSLEAFVREPFAVDPAIAELSSHPAVTDFVVGPMERVVEDGVFDQPVFIVSAPRAGSTLLYETLSRAPDLWAIGDESHGVIEGIPKLHLACRGFDSHCLAARDADPETVRALQVGFIANLRDRTGRRYLNAKNSVPGPIRFLEKTPKNALRIPFLCAAFPDARFIFLHREARQNISSILEGWGHAGFISILDLPRWTRRRWCFLLPPGWRTLDNKSLMEVAAFQWERANQSILDDLALLPADRWCAVDYEELISEPMGVVQRLCAFMDVGFDEWICGAVRHLPLSATTVTVPSADKWRTNPEFRDDKLAGLTSLSKSLRTLRMIPNSGFCNLAQT